MNQIKMKSNNMEKKVRILIFVALSIAIMLLAVLIGPMDFFWHGYYADEINLDAAEAAGALMDPINLVEDEANLRFSPMKEGMVGFEFHLTDRPSTDVTGVLGILSIQIENHNGQSLEYQEIPLSEVAGIPWYKVFTCEQYVPGENYLLRMWVEGPKDSVSLATVGGNYLEHEALDGNAAISFAYEKPTFDLPLRILIFLVLVGIWLGLVWGFFRNWNGVRKTLFNGISRFFGRAAIIVIMVAMFSWNFTYNSLDWSNTMFSGFQHDSETLVTGTLIAEDSGHPFSRSGLSSLGLRRFESALGIHKGYTLAGVTDEKWNAGYSRTEPIVQLGSCGYVSESLSRATKIRFSNGEEFPIENYEGDNTYIRVRLLASGALDPTVYGNLDAITFIGEDGFESAGGKLSTYNSQYGLQGKAYRFLARKFGCKGDYSILNFLNALLTATVLTLLVLLLSKKYGRLFAAIFYSVFLLSPWVVNFGNNLYWVEFTWFLPMIAGLVLTMCLESKLWRIVCYVAACATIAVKCLCGYEYISSVMLALIAFPIVELCVSITLHDKEKANRLFCSVIALGVAALLGFASAVCIHGVILGDGNLAEGIRWILADKAASRMSGGDLNLYWNDKILLNALSASHWETICKYFHFNTEVIAGVTGNLFQLLCLFPIAIFIYDYAKRKMDVRLVAMYAVFFLVPVSWYFLAKAHSFIHTHMNYVLWYMGFVQICFYVIARKIINIIRENCVHKECLQKNR